jgi:KTSC domain-containing protein
MPSSVISSIHYDIASSRLRIIFVSGSIYDYINVPGEIYNALKKSGSKGTYLNRHIKGHFDFKKLR